MNSFAPGSVAHNFEEAFRCSLDEEDLVRNAFGFRQRCASHDQGFAPPLATSFRQRSSSLGVDDARCAALVGSLSAVTAGARRHSSSLVAAEIVKAPEIEAFRSSLDEDDMLRIAGFRSRSVSCDVRSRASSIEARSLGDEGLCLFRSSICEAELPENRAPKRPRAPPPSNGQRDAFVWLRPRHANNLAALSLSTCACVRSKCAPESSSMDTVQAQTERAQCLSGSCKPHYS